MRKWLRRLLAAALALLLALGSLSIASAEGDWRDLLRELYGLTDDDQGEKQAETPNEGQGEKQAEAPNEGHGGQRSETDKKTEVEFQLPVIDPQQIVNYLGKYGKLPENFITKREAQTLGWDSRYNYVGEVAPGKSIGGDRFGNYDRKLPTKKGRKWYECDANYRGKRRGPERVLYSSDGLYYYSKDHYITFTQMFPEE